MFSNAVNYAGLVTAAFSISGRIDVITQCTVELGNYIA